MSKQNGQRKDLVRIGKKKTKIYQRGFYVLFSSENESPVPSPPKNITEKTRFIEQKLREASIKGQKPSINAIAQGFQPSRESLATQV